MQPGERLVLECNFGFIENEFQLDPGYYDVECAMPNEDEQGSEFDHTAQTQSDPSDAEEIKMNPGSRVILTCETNFIEHAFQLNPGYYDVECAEADESESTPTLEPTPTATSEPEPTATSTPTPTATATPSPDREEPVAGEPCPAWVHEQYTTTGPDGETYPTWHLPTDPEYGCHFGHEHGNDPGSVVAGYMPTFNYAGSRNDHEESGHGFKVWAMHDHLTGYDWVVTQHQGTAGRNVLCSRFHNVEVAVFDAGSDELMARLSFLGDFGQARFVTDGGEHQIMEPPECPDQGDVESFGQRQLNEGSGYTPYIIHDDMAGLGLSIRASFLTVDGIDRCHDYVCAEMDTSDSNTGSQRRFQSLLDDTNVNDDVPAAATGWFCTDPFGQAVVSCDDPEAVEQYLTDGFSTTLVVADSSRDVDAGANGMWYYNGFTGPAEAVADGNSVNGVGPLLPLDEFYGTN